jgi:hypothetical protein
VTVKPSLASTIMPKMFGYLSAMGRAACHTNVFSGMVFPRIQEARLASSEETAELHPANSSTPRPSPFLRER